MNSRFQELRVNAERLRANFDALAAIGATPNGGVHRPALSRAHLQARRWFLETARQAGLETRVDGAGNHSCLLRCGRSDALVLLMGSHLDSVPCGGRFDGALGVMGALEVLQTVNDHGLTLNSHLEAIDFTDEEGCYLNFVGSMGLAGKLTPGHIQAARGGYEHFRTALRRAGMGEGSLLSARRDSTTLTGYLELHVEQGGQLAQQDVTVGIVTTIVGIRSLEVRFLGRADHAGTTPMEQRLDAAQGASAFTLALRERVMTEYPGCVATVGRMAFQPGAFNVVPEAVTVCVDFRADEEAKLDAMAAMLRQQARDSAGQFGLDLEIQHLDSTAPGHMDKQVQDAIAGACKSLGLSHTFLPSGAGHDAQCLADICPTGMMLVPSVGGFSHSAREFTEWQHCVSGCNVLLHAALNLTHS